MYLGLKSIEVQKVERSKIAQWKKDLQDNKEWELVGWRDYNFYQIMSDTIYSDLKEQGLILSKQVQIGFPPIRAPTPGLIGQLVSYLMPQKSFQNQPYGLIIVPILNNCFIIGRCNTLLCYKYEIDRQTQSAKPIITKPEIYNLQFKIQKIHICDIKYINDRSQVPFLVQSKNLLVLYYVDLKQNKIIEKNSIVINNLLSVRFICDKEILVMSQSGSAYSVHHLVIHGGKIREKSKIPAELQIGNNQIVKQVNIVGNIDEQQESTICLFYHLKLKNNENSQILKIKEYVRDLDSKISAKGTYVILSTQNSVVLTQNYEIVSYENYYCILIKYEILILKKKFDRYLFIDNVMQKIGGNILKLHSKGIVTSHSGNSMQVNVILFNDPKCYSKLLDNIEIPTQLSGGFLMVWPFKNQKDTSLMFVFQKQKKLAFCNLRKTNPFQKMIMVVSNTPKQKISVVQEIAVNLGISKKDFYLNQWSHSKRQLADIYQFLLPCWDIQSIKRQLRMTMRRKKIQVSQLSKILQKLGKIIKNQLKINLTQTLLKQYIKNDFLLRKIKLKEASKRMDHRELDKIYNSSLIDLFVEIVKNQLYPSQKELDPLHAMVEAPTKEQANLKHVFQQFRMMILENYKNFLIKFISEFNESQIVEVINEYYFLFPTYKFKPNLIIHEPDYMTEVELNHMILKTEKTQQQWFSDMTSIEFNREMSKERIEKELHDYYPNSKIHEAINTLVNSEYGVKEKLHRHGLISCTIPEYKEKLHDIEDIKLYLKVCEHVNQYNLTESVDKDLSKQIVQIFRTKNKLQGQAYYKVKLYTSMHRFMLRNNFYQKKVMTAQELIQLKAEDLVALFFLQNRQRKQFIFREFRDLFVDLYKGPTEFNQIIQKFINSENCSRIQLQIFINQIRNKGEVFQVSNQQLIELIIDGFCRKLQVREDSDTQRFLDIMEEIELSKKLAMKINKITQVRDCEAILRNFNCQKQSYYNILRYQQNNQIVKILMNSYFNKEMKKDFVKIQNEEISLDYCRNMLAVLLYLQEQVYYEISVKDFLLTYCEVLIEWKEFEVIKGIVYDQDATEKLGINRDEFINQLILKTLSQIYNQRIVFDQITKEHIRQVVDIYQGQHQIKQQQQAKIQLAQIYQSLEQQPIYTQDIDVSVTGWAEGYKKQLMLELIRVHSQRITFVMLENVYRAYEIGAGMLADEVDVASEEFVEFALAYAEKLLQQKTFPQIIKVLAFVKSLPQTKKVSYALLSQTFLQCLTTKYPDLSSIQPAKQSIQYFTQNFNDDQSLHRTFQTQLDSAHFQYKSVQRQTIIPVKEGFCFSKKYTANITLDLLWEIARVIWEERERKIQVLYYVYYFLIMIFRNPESGFSRNHRISYNLEALTDSLFKLEAKIDEKNELWGINIYAILKRFLKGLYLQGLTRIKEINPDVFKTFHSDDAQLDAIKARLRQNKSQNSQLLKCISRIQTYLSAYKAVRKTEKQLRFQKLNQTRQPQKIQQQIIQLRVDTQPQLDNGVTLNLRRFKERKMQISRASNTSGILLSERDILERIYELEIEDKQTKRRVNKSNKGINNFLPGFLNTMARQGNISSIKKHIESEQWDKLRGYAIEDLIQAAQVIYDTADKDFHKVVTIFRELSIIDQKKSEVLLLTKLYMSDSFNLTFSELKKLFPFSYIISPSEQNNQEFKQQLYMVMRNSFESIVEKKDNDFIRHMANYIGNVLGENAYVARFYIDMIILMGKWKLQIQTVIRISIIMHILREYPQDVRIYLTNILEAFKDNAELLDIIKQELLICLQDLKEDQLEKYIKEY